MKPLTTLLVLSLYFSGTAAATEADLLIADFEGKDYGSWVVEGEAFGPGPARGTLPRQMQVSGFEGKGLVNTFFNGDGTTGRLTSPPLKIERRYINFLIGGGGREHARYHRAEFRDKGGGIGREIAFIARGNAENDADKSGG